MLLKLLDFSSTMQSNLNRYFFLMLATFIYYNNIQPQEQISN